MIFLELPLEVMYYLIFLKVEFGKFHSIFGNCFGFVVVFTEPVDYLKEVRKIMGNWYVVNPWLHIIIEPLVLWTFLPENDKTTKHHPRYSLPWCRLALQDKLVFVSEMVFKRDTTTAIKTLATR